MRLHIFEMVKYTKIKIFISQLEKGYVGEMNRKWGRARFNFLCNYFCTLYFLVKVQLVQLLYLTAARLNLNSVETKNVMGAKMMRFNKMFVQYPHQ